MLGISRFQSRLFCLFTSFPLFCLPPLPLSGSSYPLLLNEMFSFLGPLFARVTLCSDHPLLGSPFAEPSLHSGHHLLDPLFARTSLCRTLPLLGSFFARPFFSAALFPAGSPTNFLLSISVLRLSLFRKIQILFHLYPAPAPAPRRLLILFNY